MVKLDPRIVVKASLMVNIKSQVNLIMISMWIVMPWLDIYVVDDLEISYDGRT